MEFPVSNITDNRVIVIVLLNSEIWVGNSVFFKDLLGAGPNTVRLNIPVPHLGEVRSGLPCLNAYEPIHHFLPRGGD
jgi:hypothetical protein